MAVRDAWFDGEGFDLMAGFIQDQDSQLAQFMSDGVISKEEWLTVRERIFEQLKALEPGLTDEQHTRLTKILRDYDVLLWMTRFVEGEVLSWCTPLASGPGCGCPED